MQHEETVQLEVTDWPRFKRQTTFTFDARLFPDEQALRAYAHQRFGDGVLRKVSARQWMYARKIAGPGWFWGLLSRILNKSYA